MGSEKSEEKWDRLLQIRTSGRDDTNADHYRYPYEPTPYCVLERLCRTGYIRKTNVLLDYGCGKGRVDFFLSWQTRCRSIGIEYVPEIYNRAMENKKTAVGAGRVSFEAADAERYEVPESVDRVYFFNPFSIQLLQKVMYRLGVSYYAAPREILLFFYYPSDEYLAWLMTVEEVVFYDEIDCRDLFPGNHPREKIVIYRMGGKA